MLQSAVIPAHAPARRATVGTAFRSGVLRLYRSTWTVGNNPLGATSEQAAAGLAEAEQERGRWPRLTSIESFRYGRTARRWGDMWRGVLPTYIPFLYCIP